jgi:hypothetical protein
MPKIINDEAPDHWSQIVGMPDDWDKKNLTNLINTFKKKTFTFTDAKGVKRSTSGAAWIKYEVEDAKRSHQLDGAGTIANPFGVKSKESDMRITTAMPNELHREISESYPTIFRDKKHHSWFVKNFPEFRIASRH